MIRCDDPASASAWSEGVRARGATLGLVPTMGALHEGHLSLMRRAAEECDLACASIFVNPLQFDDPEDLERYPRDFAHDGDLLEDAGCAMVFTGTLAQFFPEIADPVAIPLRDPGRCAAGLEGDFRDGHFAGVATIVSRLFEFARPDRAYFGEKDFQQTLVVRDLARTLGYPRIVVAPTVRSAEGLALSSRNERLDDEELEQALALSRALFAAREAWRGGERDGDALQRVLLAELDHSGVEVEYAEIRDPRRWSADPPPSPLECAQALVAARVGEVRLIDNLALDDLPRGTEEGP